jgi:hypothetical protein
LVNFNEIFASGDPRSGTAQLNGREISLTALAGIADETLIGAIQRGDLLISQSDLDNLVEIRNMEGRSGLQNFLSGVGQDIGVVGETGVGGIERGGRLALFAASLTGAGKIASAGRFLPSSGLLSQARNLGSLSGITNAIRSTFTARNLAIGVGGAAGAGAIAQGIAGGDDVPLTPTEVGAINPAEETAFDAATEAGETGGDVEFSVEPDPSDPNNAFARGGTFVAKQILDEQGNPTGRIVVVDALDQIVEVIGEDELPINNPDQRERQRMLEDFGLAERRFNQTINALNTINSIRQSTGAENRANAQFQIDLANTLADPRSATVLRAGIARQPEGSGINPLLSAFTDTRPGDVRLSDTGLSGQLASLFGLQAGQDIPVPGATRTRTVAAGGEGEGLGPVDVTERGQEFDLTQIPLNNVLSSLTTEERGLFDAMLTITGTDPQEVERKRQQLAPPGSGRSVFSAFQR